MPPRKPGSKRLSQSELVGRLDRLCRLAGEIATLHAERDTLRFIVDGAVEVVGVSAAHLALVDRGERTLFGLASSGHHPPDAPKARFELERGQAANEALSTRRPVVIHDATRDRRVNPDARDLLQIGSAAYVPLLGAGKSFGLLILTTPRPQAWDRMQVRLAVYTANIAAVALQTTHLMTSLVETDGRLRNLLEDISAIVYTCDVDFPYRTYFVGQESEAVLGYTPRAWIEDPDLFGKLVHPDDVQAVIDASEEAKTRGRGFVRSEYRLLDRSGNTHWFRDEAVLLCDPAGRPQAWHGVLIDVTARKERALLAPDKAGRFKGPPPPPGLPRD
ncbi:MAG TPA: GAF domain-containing protein [Patescibacteria group bacterium]|nr:GAF domain-containing protein [Patescibacteria group bacterium]